MSLGESLKEYNKGGTDDKVAAAAVPCLTVDYLAKRLKAYLEALYHLNIRHMPVENHSVPIKSITKAKFFTLLADPDFTAWLLPQVQQHPYFYHQLSRFIERCQAPERLLEALIAHQQKVTRQIQRIYRGRNQIVHSAERVFAVEFLCANLEHYLQACVLGMIDVMSRIPTIRSPEECFVRYQHWADNLLEGLKKQDLMPLIRLLELHG